MLEELTLQAPLVLPEQGARQLQLVLSEPDEQGRRELRIYSREERSEEDEQGQEGFTLHAQGSLATLADPVPSELERLGGEPWPPPAAQALETEFLYDRLAEAGYNYGPAFQGLSAAWQTADEIYAEVALEQEHALEAQGFQVHPALLDAAFHALVFKTREHRQAGEVGIPFSFSGVRLYGRGASSLRVRLGAGAQGGVSVLALDSAGAPLLAIDSIVSRPVEQAALKTQTQAARDLYELRWSELSSASPNGARAKVALLGFGEEAIPGLEGSRHEDLAALEASLEQGASAPELVLLEAQSLAEGTAEASLAQEVHALTARTLELLQAFLSSEPLQEARLCLITDGALAITAKESPNLAQAALVGLMRSAHSEHPERFALIDTDHSDASLGALYGALVTDEPELALRQGSLHAQGGAGQDRGGSLLTPTPRALAPDHAARRHAGGVSLAPTPGGEAAARGRARCGSRCAPPGSTSATC